MRAGGLVAVAVLAVTACSDNDGETSAPPATEAQETTTTSVAEDAPTGPVADITEELTGGDGTFLGAPADRPFPDGYVESEYLAAGTARTATSAGELPGDGMWDLEPGPSAAYRTRIVVRQPERAEDFSGIVVLEWMNVSGGVDADPEWTTLREEIERQGHAWVGVSAQALGIEGGDVRVRVSDDIEGSDAAGKGLRAIDPERYGDLQHPGDAFSYDIYSQVGRAVRAGIPPLDGLEVEHLIAAGESQSAMALVTYVNGFHPDAQVYDGFFVHSRGANGLPVPAPGENADIAGSLGAPPTVLRTDHDAEMLVLQAENDVIGALRGIGARQPDSDTVRLWEVAGTAHADRRLMGADTADAIDCGAPINDGPLHVVAKAALRHLVTWVQGGDAPPEAPRLEVTEDQSAIVRDEDGIALGGIRTPPVDAPVQVLSGEQGPKPEIICILSGSTLPMPPERIAELYRSVDDYEQQYAAAVDEAVAAGFVLEDDREAIQAYARPELVTG